MKKQIAVLDRLLEVVALFNDDMEQTLGAQGITQARAHLLWRLAGGPLTSALLAESMAVTPRNVTGLVDGLVAAGFVTREPHPTDRRASLVVLTKKGGAVVREMQEGQGKLAGLLFADLTDRQLGSLQKGLDHVAAVLRRELGR